MVIIETKDSRAGQDSFEGSSCKLMYKVELQAGEDESTLRLAILLTAPTTLEPEDGSPSTFTLQRGPAVIRPVEGNIFDVEIQYYQPKPTQLSGSTGGGTAKMTYSRGTVRAYDASGLQATLSPNFQQGINVTKNAVEGVDIPISQPTFKVTKSYPLEEIDGDYLDLLEDLTGKINDAEYVIDVNGIVRSYRALELKLSNAPWQTTENNRIEITYEFEVSRGIYPDDADTWRYIGNAGEPGTIVIKDKAGWDYLWLYFEESHVDGFLVLTPKTVYIENTIAARDFSELLI